MTDRTTYMTGQVPCISRSDETFLVQSQGSGFAVRASTFCRHYRNRVPTTEEFLRPELAGGNTAPGTPAPAKTLLLNLRHTMTVGGIERKKRVKELTR